MASPRTAPSAAHVRLRPARRVRRALLPLAVVLAVALPVLPAAATPGEEPQTSAEAASLAASKAHELEVVTEAFNDAREELKAHQAAAQQAAEQVDVAQAELAAAQQGVRGVARSAFTGEGLSGFSALLTSDSADEFVGRLSALEMVAGHQGELLDRAARAGVAAAEARAAAGASAAAAQEVYDRVAGQQADLEAQIAEFRALHERLSDEERQAAVAAAATHAAAEERASRDDGDRSAPEPYPAAPSTESASAAGSASTEPSSRPVVAGSRAAQVAVDTAMAQRGKPYVWAAAGPGSFDCSGLTQFAYAAAGIGLPHSSRMQAQLGTRVSRSELAPGDLVFFYEPISHVGIYLGDGRMVHAPTFGDVVKVTAIDAMGGYSHGVRLA